MNFIMVFPLLLLVTNPGLNQAGAEDTELHNLSSIMEKAREEGEKMTLPVNQHTEEGLKAAEKTADTFHSPEFQKQIQCEQQRLEQEVFEDYISSWKKKKQKPAEGQAEQAGSLTATERVYLFFSSSMPDETVHSYMSTIADTGDPHVVPVMRGFVGGMEDMKASTKYFSRILKEDPDCQDNLSLPCQRYQVGIKLNPPLFAQYGITRVPAVVYENESEGFLVQGDAGLDYFLERINREAKSITLDNLIKKMRGEGH